MKRLRTVLIVIALFTALTSVAQIKEMMKNIPANQAGRLIVTVNGPEKVQLKDIEVFFLYFADTIRSDKQINNTFIFEKLIKGEFYVGAKAKGFEQVIDTVTIEERKETKKTLTLKNRLIKLPGVVVKGKTPMMTHKGDTIQFNPAAVNIMEGDMARSILEQMPGVSVTDNLITIQGNPIESTYVDGRKLFGDNPTMAIDHVSADDVLTIKAYEETKKRKQGKKLDNRKDRNWVMDIVTKSKMVNSTDAQMLASAGATLGEVGRSGHHFRGAIGGVFNFFSDSLLVNANIMHNNFDIASNNNTIFFRLNNNFPNYSDNTVVGVNLKRQWLKRNNGITEWSINYQFSRIHMEIDRQTKKEYIATEDYEWRNSITNSTRDHQDNKHQIGSGMKIEHERWGTLKASVSQTFSHRRANNTDQMTENSSFMSFTSSTDNRHRYKDEETEVILSHGVQEKSWEMQNEAKYHQGHKDRVEYRINGMAYNDDTEHIDNRLEIPLDQRQEQWMLNPTWILYIDKERKNRLIVEYKYMNSKDNINQVAKNDLTDGIDSLNTYSYRQHSISHSFQVDYGSMLNNNIGWGLTLNPSRSQISDLREDVGKEKYSFKGLGGVISFGTKPNRHHLVSMYFERKQVLPNITQLRTTVDNSFPYMVTTGNPTLKAMYKHSLHFQYNYDGNHGERFVLNTAVTSTQDYISNAMRYFPEPEFLPTWGFTAAKGSTLSSFENLHGAWNVENSIDINLPITSIRSFVGIFLRDDYARLPSLYNSTQRYTYSNIFTSNFRLIFNKIPKTRIIYTEGFQQHDSHTSYSEIRNRNYSITNTMELSRSAILKYGFFKMRYNFKWQKNRAMNEIQRDHLLNVHAGVKLMKGTAEVSIIAFDLLNSYKDRKISMFEDYMQWSEGYNYGRYVALNFVWNIRKLKTSRFDIGRGVNW